MTVLDFEAFAKCREEIKEHKKIIDDLTKMNTELQEKVNEIYGAYQTLQYSCEGRCSLYGTELERLRKKVEELQNELGHKNQ